MNVNKCKEICNNLQQSTFLWKTKAAPRNEMKARKTYSRVRRSNERQILMKGNVSKRTTAIEIPHVSDSPSLHAWVSVESKKVGEKFTIERTWKMQATKTSYISTQKEMREEALFLSFPIPEFSAAFGMRDYTPTNSPMKKPKTKSSAPVMKHSYEVIAYNVDDGKVLIETTDFWSVHSTNKGDQVSHLNTPPIIVYNTKRLCLPLYYLLPNSILFYVEKSSTKSWVIPQDLQSLCLRQVIYQCSITVQMPACNIV